MNPGKPIALLATSTGVAAIKIDGTMSDQKRTQMKLPLGELKLIIIHEISTLLSSIFIND